MRVFRRLRRTYHCDMTGEVKRLEVGEFARWWEETGEYELRQILHWKWDPIGVADEFPYAADEYHSYALPVVSALIEGQSADAIAEMFGNIEHEWMGLGEGPLSGVRDDRLRDLAVGTLAWFEASQIRWVEFGPLRP